MSAEPIDNRRPGELDLADLVDSYYLSELPMESLTDVVEAAMDRSEQRVREMLEEKGVNLYFDQRGNVRRQES